MRRIVVCGAVLLCVAVAGSAPVPSSAPAAADSDAQLEQCMRHCRDTFTAIEGALRAVERAQASGDPLQWDAALRRVGPELIAMREQMSNCMQKLEQVRRPSTCATRPAVLAESWVCPMHSQIRRDSPGNCPLCDATLKPVADGRLASTRPALAASPGETIRANEGSVHATVGR